MNYPIRKATEKDLSRIGEILVFVKRIKYRPIFKNDAFSFGEELQVISVAKQCSKPEILSKMYVYDDGIIKGLIQIDKEELVQLYVDYFFWNQGVGSALLDYAIQEHNVSFLWALEKNKDAIRFYERHGFHLTDTKKLEEGTDEYLVMMKR